MNDKQKLQRIRELRKEQQENCCWEIRKDIEKEINNLINEK